MNQNNFKFQIGKPTQRRGVAEVISSLLLVAITVAGAVILTSFLDESFVSGSLAVTSGTDTAIKTIHLTAYDTRNGNRLMGSIDYALNNTNTQAMRQLCRASCTGVDASPENDGSNFMIIQIQNRSINPIYVKDIILDGVAHSWDADTSSKGLNFAASDSSGGLYPSNGEFSVLSNDITDTNQGDNQIEGGQTVNLLIKLDTNNADIELSKTMRVQVNIGANSLSNFLIETGDTR